MLDNLPKELLIKIIEYNFKFYKNDSDNKKQQKYKICELVFINRSIASTLLNSEIFWGIIITLFSNKDIMFYTNSRLDKDIYNSIYYHSSQCKIRDYLKKEIIKNGGNRHSIEISNSKLLNLKTSVCSIPYESSFLIGGLGKNNYPFLRAYNYKGEEQINYLLSNRMKEYMNKPINSISCRNKLLAFSVYNSNIISVLKTNGLNEDKCGYLETETIKSNCKGTRNILQINPNKNKMNQLLIGGSDGSSNIYDLNHLFNDNDETSSSSSSRFVSNIWNHKNYNKLSIWDNCFSNDGNLIFEVGETINCQMNEKEYCYRNSGFVRCWDTRIERDKCVNFQIAESIEIGGISQSDDSKCIGYVGRSGLTRIIDLRYTSKPLILFSPEKSLSYDFSRNSIFYKDSICWLPGGSNYLVSSSFNELNVWSINGENSNFLNFKINKRNLNQNQIGHDHDELSILNNHNHLAITEDGLLLCTYDTIYSINDCSEISINEYFKFR